MLNVDAAALECDLAETYNIYDYKELPITKVALFSVGLRENSRIKLAMCGQNYPVNTVLMASVVDGISTIVWLMSGAKKSKMPEFIIPKMFKIKTDDGDIVLFANGEDFERKRKEILEKMGGN